MTHTYLLRGVNEFALQGYVDHAVPLTPADLRFSEGSAEVEREFRPFRSANSRGGVWLEAGTHDDFYFNVQPTGAFPVPLTFSPGETNGPLSWTGGDVPIPLPVVERVSTRSKHYTAYEVNLQFLREWPGFGRTGTRPSQLLERYDPGGRKDIASAQSLADRIENPYGAAAQPVLTEDSLLALHDPGTGSWISADPSRPIRPQAPPPTAAQPSGPGQTPTLFEPVLNDYRPLAAPDNLFPIEAVTAPVLSFALFSSTVQQQFTNGEEIAYVLAFPPSGPRVTGFPSGLGVDLMIERLLGGAPDSLPESVGLSRQLGLANTRVVLVVPMGDLASFGRINEAVGAWQYLAGIHAYIANRVGAAAKHPRIGTVSLFGWQDGVERMGQLLQSVNGARHAKLAPLLREVYAFDASNQAAGVARARTAMKAWYHGNNRNKLRVYSSDPGWLKLFEAERGEHGAAILPNPRSAWVLPGSGTLPTSTACQGVQWFHSSRVSLLVGDAGFEAALEGPAQVQQAPSSSTSTLLEANKPTGAQALTQQSRVPTPAMDPLPVYTRRFLLHALSNHPASQTTQSGQPTTGATPTVN